MSWLNRALNRAWYLQIDDTLWQACVDNSADDLKHLLKSYEHQEPVAGFHEDPRTRLLRQLFYCATENNACEIVRFLRTQDVDLSLEDIGYYFATGQVSPELADLLESHGWDVRAMSAADPMEWEPMFYRVMEAAKRGDLEYFGKILDYERRQTGPNLGQEGEHYGVTEALQAALNEAIAYGAIKLLRYVLREGADVSQVRLRNNPSLAILQILLDFGYDIHKPPGALYLVAGDEEKVQWCLAHGADPSTATTGLLDRVAMVGNMPLFRLLRSRGAPIHRCLLHFVVQAATSSSISQDPMASARLSEKYEKYLPFVRYLVEEEHVDVNMLDWVPGKDEPSLQELQEILGTPLHCCMEAEGSGLDIVRYLLEQGALPNIKDYEGFTALHKAKAESCLAFVEVVEALCMDRDLDCG